MLHKLWVERCNIVHESTVSDVRIEDHHQLLVHVRRLYRSCDIEENNVLWQYRNRLSTLSSDTLRGIMHEFFSVLEDVDKGEGVTEHLRSLGSHSKTTLSEEVLRTCNDATSRRHRYHMAKRSWNEVG